MTKQKTVFKEAYPDIDTGFVYIYYLPRDESQNRIFCYGGDVTQRDGERRGVEHSDLEKRLDTSPEVESENVDIHNSLRGRIYPEQKKISVSFSTRYREEEEVKKIMQEILPELKRRFGVEKIQYSVGDYGSDKEKRQEALRRGRERLQPGSKCYDQGAALRAFMQKRNATSEMDDGW